MKTQRTKLVARIAMALLAGMMVLALASCGSKDPLKGHIYEGKYNGEKVTYEFTKGNVLVVTGINIYGEADGVSVRRYIYKVDTDTFTVTTYEDKERMAENSVFDRFSYAEDGLSFKVSWYGEIEMKRVK